MFLVFALAGSTMAAPVPGGSAPKATGGAWFDRTAEGIGMAHTVFVAQATTPAKGTFTYSDPNGAYTFDVQAVKIDSATVVHFAGPVVSSTYPGIGVDKFVGIAVRDGGEPGVGVDRLNGAVYGTLAAAVAGFATLSPDYLTVAEGNLQVHAKICTFAASDSSYYDGPTSSAPLYANGPITFSWLMATGDVYAGEWTEIHPATSGTVYHNVIATGTVVGDQVNLTTAVRTNPNDGYASFIIAGTLIDGVFTGTAAGPYLLTATGAVTCGVAH
jgi:hypothetical protein